jgi:hypothetical protein
MLSDGEQLRGERLEAALRTVAQELEAATLGLGPA